jgi:hypothetical protein
MKRLSIVIVAILAATLYLSGAVQQASTPPSQSPKARFIEIPVRVLDGGRFVDTLRAEDFELSENGRPQKIEALYLVRKGLISREEASPDIRPQTHRVFYLFFQMTEYFNKMEEAISGLFKNMLQPDDAVVIVTPLRQYALSAQAIKTKSKETLIKEMTSLLRKDIQESGSDYRSVLSSLKMIMRSISGSQGGMDKDVESGLIDSSYSLESLLTRYRSTLQKLESVRLVDETKFMNFANVLKNQEGQKFVFFFYQREFRPELNGNVLNQLILENQDRPGILANLSDLNQFYQRDINLDLGKVSRVYADADVNFNFIFMDNTAKSGAGITMREQAEDVFRIFTAICQATGGVQDSSPNPAAGFMKTAESAENYYLLYYAAPSTLADGSFRTVAVRIKDKDYSIKHRLGFFAK